MQLLYTKEDEVYNHKHFVRENIERGKLSECVSPNKSSRAVSDDDLTGQNVRICGSLMRGSETTLANSAPIVCFLSGL